MHPFIHVFGYAISSYGLMIVIGCGASVTLSVRRSKRLGFSGDDAGIIMACAGGLAIVGAKLLFVVTAIPLASLVAAIKEGNIQYLVEGGQVFYGGAIGGFLGALLGLRITRAHAEPYLRAILPTIPLGHAIGRIGCLLAGCCYGVPYTGRFSVVYTHPVGGAPVGVPLFPVQNLEALLNVFIFVMLICLSKKANGHWVALAYAALYAVNRFILEFFRYDAVRGIVWKLSTSQWISIFLLIGSCILSIPLQRKTRAEACVKSTRQG